MSGTTAGLARRLKTPVRRWLNARGLARLASSAHPLAPAIARALAPGSVASSEEPLLEAIEVERRAMLASDVPLVAPGSSSVGPYDEGRTVRDACAVSKSPAAARSLYRICRALGSQRVLELGTNVGISSAYLAAALRAGRYEGRLATLEASPHRQTLARALHARLGLERVDYVSGYFRDTLAGALEAHGPVDLAFVDGHHQYQPTLDYFEVIARAAAPGAVVVFDDIRWSSGMKRAWARLRSNPRFGLVVDLTSVGICALGPTGVPAKGIPRLRLF